MEFISNFTVILISIILEALPFILLGSLASGIIEVFVSEQFICRILSRRGYISMIVASFTGLILPVCECTTVPVSRRLIVKGVPFYAVVTFMVAVPQINLLTIFSTSIAFSYNIKIIFIRILTGFLISLAAGILSVFIFKERGKDLYIEGKDENCCYSIVSHSPEEVIPLWKKIGKLMEATIDDFFYIGFYFLTGAFCAAAVQTFFPKQILSNMASGEILSIVLMMAASYLLCLCSEANAFIAKSFARQFPLGSVMAFMLFGPMIDLRITFMLHGALRKRVVVKLMLLIISLNFIAALIINFLFKR